VQEHQPRVRCVKRPLDFVLPRDHSGAVQLVNGGSNAVAACENMMEATAMFRPSDWQPYDSMSFNSGCYDAIRDNGDPVKNADGVPVPGYN
jgi:hypothetical protein